MSITNNIKKFVAKQNQSKKILTPGPASLLTENITNLKPCFGRGDPDYAKIEKFVLNNILE